MITPCTVYMQVATPYALLAEPELFHHSPAGVVLRPDAGLDPVQPDDEEAVVHGHRERGRGAPAAGPVLADPVAHLCRPRRSPDDAAHGELPDEPAVKIGRAHV